MRLAAAARQLFTESAGDHAAPWRAAHRPSGLPAPKRTRAAWSRRSRLLDAAGRPALARGFLRLVSERARVSCSVTEAAALLGVSRSALERMCRDTFRISPGVILNLGRVESVARDLRDTPLTLQQVSYAHAFPAPSIMSRLFHRFTGTSPGRYRARSRRRPMRRIDHNLMKIDH